MGYAETAHACSRCSARSWLHPGTRKKIHRLTIQAIDSERMDIVDTGLRHDPLARPTCEGYRAFRAWAPGHAKAIADHKHLLGILRGGVAGFLSFGALF